MPDNGKVIVVEVILPFIPNTSSSFKAIAHLDAFMMTQLPGGKERTEDEFRALAKGAGFTGIRKKCFVCNFWVIEFYKYIFHLFLVVSAFKHLSLLVQQF